MLHKLKTLVVAGALAVAGPAFSAIVVLDFEGVGNNNPVGDFYNGGGGTNYGVSFSKATLAIVDADAGGTGNIANEPTPNTVMFFLDANNAVLNYGAGFTTGFSFFYSSAAAATVSVYDGLDGNGNLLGTLNLTAQFSNGCAGDPAGDYCNWTAVGVSFEGTARSIDFGGTANRIAFDNITFGTNRPVVPEPSTYALMLAGLGSVGVMLRRRRQS